MKSSNRLTSITHKINIGAYDRINSETKLREINEGHELMVTISYENSGHIAEMMFTGRGKIGHGMDNMLRELGIKISRMIQHRDPQPENESAI